MRILYHSAVPWASSGYGRCTREISTRLHNTDHEVAVQCMNNIVGSEIQWHGEESPVPLDDPMTIYPSKGNCGIDGVENHFEDFNADIYFTHFDTWMDEMRKKIPRMGIPYASYVIVDHSPTPKAVADQVSNAHKTIAMSRFAERGLRKRGIRPEVIPHGVNTKKYIPLGGEGLKIETEGTDGSGNVIDTEDRFVVGMVAANFGNRKRIPHHIEAFDMFRKEVDEDPVLYIHTEQNTQKGFQLKNICDEIGIPDDYVIWTPPDLYNDVGDHYLNNLYNMFDVLVNCSMGESWGLTITEAMSAGTPCIVNNFSSMPEQVGISEGKKPNWIHKRNFTGGVGKTPHGIVVDPCVHIWKGKVDAKHYICHPQDIKEAMMYYYNNQGIMRDDGSRARKFVEENYDWEDCVVPKFKEMFNELEVMV